MIELYSFITCVSVIFQSVVISPVITRATQEQISILVDKIRWWVANLSRSPWQYYAELVPTSVFGNTVIDTSGAFTLDIKSVLNENLGGILGGTQC
jgi:hypothetical protein